MFLRALVIACLAAAPTCGDFGPGGAEGSSPCGTPGGPDTLSWTCRTDPQTGATVCRCAPAPPPRPRPPTPPPQTVIVAPSADTLATGEAGQFIAVPYDTVGRVFVEPSVVVWSVADTNVARIREGPVYFDPKSGNSTYVMVVGVARGATTIVATVVVTDGGRQTSGSATVRVE